VTLLLAALLAGCHHEATPAQKTVELYVESDGDFLAFRPDTLTCPSGALVRVTFHHTGKFLSARHNWMLVYPADLEPLTQDALANDGIIAKGDPRVIAATEICDRGQSVTTQFVAPAPGDYPFLCSTHPEDMRGILHVTK
jgi:azurin